MCYMAIFAISINHLICIEVAVLLIFHQYSLCIFVEARCCIDIAFCAI